MISASDNRNVRPSPVRFGMTLITWPFLPIARLQTLRTDGHQKEANHDNIRYHRSTGPKRGSP